MITLGELNADDADMRTMIIVGSSQTRILERSGYDLPWVYRQDGRSRNLLYE